MSRDFLKDHPHLQFFCTFMGYPKSGHSLIGSLLDAHPDMIIAHEQHVLKCIRLGFPAQTIFGLLMHNSERFARNGRTWNGYGYSVPGQWNGRVRKLRVIGDKKGGGATKQLQHHPELLDRLMQCIPLHHKFIHVIRNPFDSISTLSKRSKRSREHLVRRFSDKWEIVSRLKENLPPSDWCEIRHERFIKDPRKGLQALCGFLGQEASPEYLEDCAAIVRPMPHKSRLETRWSLDAVKQVEAEMKPYPFLEGYSFES